MCVLKLYSIFKSAIKFFSHIFSKYVKMVEEYIYSIDHCIGLLKLEQMGFLLN